MLLLLKFEYYYVIVRYYFFTSTMLARLLSWLTPDTPTENTLNEMLQQQVIFVYRNQMKKYYNYVVKFQEIADKILPPKKPVVEEVMTEDSYAKKGLTNDSN